MYARTRTRSPEFVAFLEAFSDGADCAALLTLRSQIGEDGHPGDLHRAIQILELLGCFGANGHGTGSDGVPDTAQSVKDYRAAYKTSAEERRAIVRESRAADVVDAALWYSSTLRGPAFRAVFVACLDALTGRPSRH